MESPKSQSLLRTYCTVTLGDSSVLETRRVVWSTSHFWLLWSLRNICLCFLNLGFACISVFWKLLEAAQIKASFWFSSGRGSDWLVKGNDAKPRCFRFSSNIPGTTLLVVLWYYIVLGPGREWKTTLKLHIVRKFYQLYVNTKFYLILKVMWWLGHYKNIHWFVVASMILSIRLGISSFFGCTHIITHQFKKKMSKLIKTLLAII